MSSAAAAAADVRLYFLAAPASPAPHPGLGPVTSFSAKYVPRVRLRARDLPRHGTAGGAAGADPAVRAGGQSAAAPLQRLCGPAPAVGSRPQPAGRPQRWPPAFQSPSSSAPLGAL
eukprot:scaffold82377_cov21-Prasinocladus_malaysianus.AAC.1